MSLTNKKSPGAKGILQPLNRQGAGHAPLNKAGLAPLTRGSAHSIKQPIAPPVYRPQPTPKVLQTKSSLFPSPPKGQAPRQPVAPPVYRPEAKKIVQPQANWPQRSSPKSPPVYRPQQRKPGQPEIASAAQKHMPPKAPPIYRPNPKPSKSGLAVQKKSTRLNKQVPTLTPARQKTGPFSNSNSGARHTLVSPATPSSRKKQLAARPFRSTRLPRFSASPRVVQGKFLGQNVAHKKEVEKMEEMAAKSIAWAIDGLTKTVAYLKDEIPERPRAFGPVSKWLGWSQSVTLEESIASARAAAKVLNLVLNSEWKIYDDADDDSPSPSPDLAFGYATNGSGRFYLLSGFYDANVLLKLDTLIHEATHAIADTSDHGCKSTDDALELARLKPDLAPTCAYNLAGLAVTIMNDLVSQP